MTTLPRRPNSNSVKRERPPTVPLSVRMRVAGTLSLLDLTPTEKDILHHILAHGRNACWTSYDSGDLRFVLTGHIGASAGQIGRAITDLRRRGYLWKGHDAHNRPVLELTGKLIDDVEVAEKRRLIFQAVGVRMWERLGGYTPEMVDAVDEGADTIKGRDRERWQAAAKQIAIKQAAAKERAEKRAEKHTVIELSDARQLVRNRRESTKPL